MTIPTCAVTITANRITGGPAASAVVRAVLTRAEAYESVVVPDEVTATTDSSGVCTINLWPNTLGLLGGSRYRFTISTGARSIVVHAVVPNAASANLEDILSDDESALPTTSAVRTVGGVAPDSSGDITKAQLESALAIRTSSDFYGYLNDAQKADVRSAAPSINLTTLFHSFQAALWALYGTPSENGKNAQGVAIEFAPGTYLFDYLDLYPGGTYIGANKHETRFLQSATASRNFAVVLAVNGTVKRSRTANARLSNITLQGNTLELGDPGYIGIFDGLSTALPSTDPNFDSAKNYNSFTVEDCAVLNFSGDGIVTKQRGRAEVRNTRTQYNGGNGCNIQGPDCIVEHLASGNNGKHSFYTSGASTPRLVNAEVWASENDQDGYGAVCFDRVRECFIVGGDVNGPIIITGAQGDPEDDFYGYWAKCLITGVDIKWRGSNFTDSSDGTPFPVGGYIKVAGFRHVDVLDVVVTPAYARNTGEFTYRPLKLVDVSGQASVNVRASLPPRMKLDTDGVTLIPHPLWPFGPARDGAGAFANSLDDVCDVPDRCTYDLTFPEVEGQVSVRHFNRVQYTRGGLLGNSLGESAANGEISEVKSSNVTAASPVTITAATVTNLGSITLPPGRWQVSGQAVFGGSGASATVIGASIADTATSFKATDARYFSRMSIPFTTLTGTELDTRTIPGFVVVATTDTTVYLNVRANFSDGTMTAYGRIQATRIG
jgi:hypothetical protein